MCLIRFRAKVREIIEMEQIDLVVFEQAAGRFKHALINAGEYHGVLKTLLEDLKKEYRSYSAPSIKKFATGKGNAKKPEMIAAAEAAGHSPADDNEADAIWLYKLAEEDLRGGWREDSDPRPRRRKSRKDPAD